jgi:hypothetical protein
MLFAFRPVLMIGCPKSPVVRCAIDASAPWAEPNAVVPFTAFFVLTTWYPPRRAAVGLRTLQSKPRQHVVCHVLKDAREARAPRDASTPEHAKSS